MPNMMMKLKIRAKTKARGVFDTLPSRSRIASKIAIKLYDYVDVSTTYTKPMK